MAQGNVAYRDSMYVVADSLYARAAAIKEVPALLFNQGNSRYQQAAYDDAISYWKTVADQDGMARDVLYNIGTAHLQNGKIQEAITSFKQALRIDPSYEMAQHNLSLALLAQQQEQEQQEQQEQEDQESSEENNQEQEQQEQENQDQGGEQEQENQEQEQGEQGEQNDGESSDESEQNPSEETAQPTEDVTEAELLQLLEILENEDKKVQRKIQGIEGRQKSRDKDW